MTAGGAPGPGTAGPASGGGGAAGARALAALLRDRLGASDLEARRSFTVAELRRSLLPYPLCRERLELASKAEYDVALLRLLVHETVLETDDRELVEEVGKELASPEPGLGVLDDHAASSLRPGPGLAAGRGNGVRHGADAGAGAPDGEAPDAAPSALGASGSGTSGPDREGGGKGHAAADPGASAGGEATDRDETPPAAVGRQEERPRPADPPGPGSGAARAGGGAETAASTPESCGACGSGLPDAEGVRFCPACGADVAVPRCGACGGEVDAGWRYCPFCGSETGA